MDITDHYTLVEAKDGSNLFNTIDEARVAAESDDLCIWFIRHGDEACSCPEDQDCDCDDLGWDVESWHGQFVNCLGFFVTTQPCRPEHRDTVFTY